MKTIKVMMAALILVAFSFAGVNTINAQSKNTAILKIKTSAVCGTCKEKIEGGLAYEKGVKKAKLNLETKVVTVEYVESKTTPEKIRLAISRLGYDADTIPADKMAYSKLSPCCKKDAPKH
jgi:copper chaperone CopZ